MIAKSLVGLVAASTLASACAPELYKRDGLHPAHIQRRQHTSEPVADSRGWKFDLSEEWNSLNPAWGACFAGKQQSPIDFRLNWGFATSNPPKFNYPEALKGKIDNWDFGPQFKVDVGSDNKTAASIEFDQDGQSETAYFRSWHTHSPAEHTINGYQPRAEIHFVHYSDDGSPRSVVGFFLDRAANYAGSPFYKQLDGVTMPTFFGNQTVSNVTLNLNLAIQEAHNYKNFWTYKGSLTTPPCLEGLRWFVSGNIIWLSDDQLESLLSVSTFGARPVNRVWAHDVNV